MTPEEISRFLTDRFGNALQTQESGIWQVELPDLRLLVLLSEDQSWLRLLVPIAPQSDAEPFLEQLMAANFDFTQETRYALQQGVLWGVFQHSLMSLSEVDFSAAISRLIDLGQRGLNDSFNELVEQRVRQIIQVAKQQGQSLEETMQTLDRFYQEGVMGSIGQSAAAREETLAAWRRQLERLWAEEG